MTNQIHGFDQQRFALLKLYGRHLHNIYQDVMAKFTCKKDIVGVIEHITGRNTLITTAQNINHTTQLFSAQLAKGINCHLIEGNPEEGKATPI